MRQPDGTSGRPGAGWPQKPSAAPLPPRGDPGAHGLGLGPQARAHLCRSAPRGPRGARIHGRSSPQTEARAPRGCACPARAQNSRPGCLASACITSLLPGKDVSPSPATEGGPSVKALSAGRNSGAALRRRVLCLARGCGCHSKQSLSLLETASLKMVYRAVPGTWFREGLGSLFGSPSL